MSVWSSDLFLTFGATVLGGAISTITSFIVQRQSNKFALGQAKNIEISARRSGAFRAMLLLSNSVAEAKSLRDLIQGSIDRARAADPKLTELWQLVANIAGMGHVRPEINPEDLTFLVEMKDYAFLEKVFDIEKRRRIVFDAFYEYQTIRRDAVAGIPTTSIGGVLNAALDSERAGLFDKHAVQMNTLMSEIIDSLDRIALDGPPAVRDFGKLAQRYFKDNSFPLADVVPRPNE